MRSTALLLIAASCSPVKSLFVERAWPADTPAVLIVVDSSSEDASIELVPPESRWFLPMRDTAFELYVRTYAELSAVTDASACRLSLGGENAEVLGAPTDAWYASSDRAANGTLVLEKESNPKPFDVRVAGCKPPPPTCDVGVQLVSAGTTANNLNAAAALSDDTVIFAGEERSDVDPRSLFLKLDPSGVKTLAAHDPLIGPTRGLDRRGDHLVGATSNAVFVLDLEGRLVASSTVSFPIFYLDSGTDGATIFVGREGQLLFMPPGETRVVPLASPQNGPTAAVRPRVAVASQNRALLAGSDRRLYFWDGTSWRRELPDIEGFSAVAIDDRSMFVVTNDKEPLVNDGSGWRLAGDRIFNDVLEATAEIGDGRFLVVGQTGRITFWNGERFCDLGSATDRNLADVDLSPSGRVAWIAGAIDAEHEPAVVRVEIPIR